MNRANVAPPDDSPLPFSRFCNANRPVCTRAAASVAASQSGITAASQRPHRGPARRAQSARSVDTERHLGAVEFADGEAAEQRRLGGAGAGFHETEARAVLRRGAGLAGIRRRQEAQELAGQPAPVPAPAGFETAGLGFRHRLVERLRPGRARKHQPGQEDRQGHSDHCLSLSS